MEKWLKNISGPADLKNMTVAQLTELAEEIRVRMLRVTAVNGGHLASSMGVVELTIALHKVLDTPRDRLVWDVGHQAYPHKLLTGRANDFDTIRQRKGLSGFLKRSESAYDAFGAGHASTAISAALGMALARDRRGENYRVVSVTGDGAMSGGLCYEALNTAGGIKPDMLMVLNDNEMSISENVGAMSTYFNKIVTTQFYNRTKTGTRSWVEQLPAGRRVSRMINRLEESVKGLILPGIFFEDLGIRYIGPIDGHNITELIETLERIKTFKGPLLLHVLTTKGKGRPYAEADPVTWHSPPAHFDADSGVSPARQPGPPSWTQVFADSLAAHARRDERIVGITAAMLEGTGLVSFQKEFPERTYDVGIAEENAVVMAAGMACDGLRPAVCIYSTFLQRSIDCIMHDVALQKLPVFFGVDRGGLVGADGPTHHGVYDLTYLRMIPNLVVMAPSTGAELQAMTATAMQYEDGPIAMRYPRGSVAGDAGAEEPAKPLEIGRGRWARRSEDREICLVGIGTMANHALEAAELLKNEGIDAGVIDARFVKPLDRDLILGAAREYGRLITVEDNAVTGGFGAGLSELLAAEDVQTPLTHLGVPDRFIGHGTPAELYEECGLSPRAIAARVRGLVHGRVHEGLVGHAG